MLTLAVTGPGVDEPDVGFKLNQLALSETFQLRLPPPLLVILKDWLAGLAAPWVAVKLRLAGLTAMLAGAVVTVKVTGTVTGVAPVALSVTVAL